MRVCTRCIMDESDAHITFDESGVCNHCKEYFELEKRKVIGGEEGQKKLKQVFDLIKKQGTNKQYDSLLGVSGGADSSYVAYLAKKHGLRTLLVHIDNEWDTEIALKNVEQIQKYTGFDLEYVGVDWEVFKDLQLAYFKASVIDIEAVTDHAINATMRKIAEERNIKNSIDGHNIRTEGILARSWTYVKQDLSNLKDIHRKHGTIPMAGFPTMSLFKMFYYLYVAGHKIYYPLDYVDYNRQKVIKTLEKEMGWINYGDKHCESLFTKFTQRYILPLKWNVDKRKAHLSTLVCSGQITREQALERMKDPLFKKGELEQTKKHVASKLGLTVKELDDLIALPKKSHYDYDSNAWMYYLLIRFVRFYGRLRRIFS